MPNGDDKNWVRVCLAIDGFRIQFGRWPTRVRLPPAYFENVVGHVLNPAGFALVSTLVEIMSDEDLTENVAIIAEDGERSQFRYGEDSNSAEGPEPDAMCYFGQAIFRNDLH